MGVDFGRDPDFDDSLDELALLAQTAGDLAVARVLARGTFNGAADRFNEGMTIDTLVSLDLLQY